MFRMRDPTFPYRNDREDSVAATAARRSRRGGTKKPAQPICGDSDGSRQRRFDLFSICEHDTQEVQPLVMVADQKRLDHLEMPMQKPSARYRGYRSFDYLEPHADYRVFDLAPEIGRVPAYDLGLDEEQARRVTEILGREHVISLHEHPKILTTDPSLLKEYNGTGRNAFGFEGIARSGMTAFFDNFMNGTNTVTSEHGWKWNDVVFDLGLRFADVAQQDHVVLARTVADLEKAKAEGRIALVAGLEAATMIENELDRLDVLYGLGVRQMGIAYSMANQLGAGLAEPQDGGLTTFGGRAVDRMNALGIAIDISHS